MVHERLLHPDQPRAMLDLTILPSRLPVPLLSSSIRSQAIVTVLPIKRAEEVPLEISAPDSRSRRKIPRLAFVKIGFSDCVDTERFVLDLSLEVVSHEFFVGGVKAKSRCKESRLRRRSDGMRWRRYEGLIRTVHLGLTVWEMREEASFRRKEVRSGNRRDFMVAAWAKFPHGCVKVGETIIHAYLIRIVTSVNVARFYWIIISLSEWYAEM